MRLILTTSCVSFLAPPVGASLLKNYPGRRVLGMGKLSQGKVSICPTLVLAVLEALRPKVSFFGMKCSRELAEPPVNSVIINFQE
jgi:hypothetical protein